MSDDDDETALFRTKSAINLRSCALCEIITDVFREKGVIPCRFEGYLQYRTKHGAFNCLVRDLQVQADDKPKHYIGPLMDLSNLDELFSLVE